MGEIKTILYVGNPNLIHDLKWMTFFSSKPNYNCFLIARRQHEVDGFDPKFFYKKTEIRFVGYFNDISTWRLVRNYKSYLSLKKLIWDIQPDIIHIFYAEPNALLSLLLPKRLKKILTTRGTDVLVTIPGFKKKKDLLSRIVYKKYLRAFRRFDFITCTSKQQLKEVEHLVSDRSGIEIQLVRTGVDLRQINDNQEHMPEVLNGKSFIFFPRNMRPVYNHELAIEAIRNLSEPLLDHYHFLFINADSQDVEYVDYIKKLMNELPTRKVIFLDSVSQQTIFSLYKKASLVVMTNKSDGSPVSAMEVMLLETPLILPPLNYDQDIFSQVSKFESWNGISLARKIEYSLSMVDAGNLKLNKRTIKEKCDREKEMQKVEKLYSISKV